MLCSGGLRAIFPCRIGDSGRRRAHRHPRAIPLSNRSKQREIGRERLFIPGVRQSRNPPPLSLKAIAEEPRKLGDASRQTRTPSHPSSFPGDGCTYFPKTGRGVDDVGDDMGWVRLLLYTQTNTRGRPSQNEKRGRKRRIENGNMETHPPT